MLPVQRKSRSQSRKGRSHHALTPTGFVRCPNCGSFRPSHRACGECGFVPPRSGSQPGLIIHREQEE